MMKNKIPSSVWLTASSARGRPTDDSDVGRGGGAEAPPVGGSAGVAALVTAHHRADHQRPVGEHLQSVPGGEFSISCKLICLCQLIFHVRGSVTSGPGNLVKRVPAGGTDDLQSLPHHSFDLWYWMDERRPWQEIIRALRISN